MELMGFVSRQSLHKREVVVDLGAGRGEFGAYLRHRWPTSGHIYLPIDASIDGCDLEDLAPWVQGATFYTAIEFLEHLSHISVSHFLAFLPYRAVKGAVITTPNPKCTDVLGMDTTHQTPINQEWLREAQWECEAQPLFTEKPDTLVAWSAGR
jgi:hypothetical protein